MVLAREIKFCPSSRRYTVPSTTTVRASSSPDESCAKLSETSSASDVDTKRRVGPRTLSRASRKRFDGVSRCSQLNCVGTGASRRSCGEGMVSKGPGAGVGAGSVPGDGVCAAGCPTIMVRSRASQVRAVYSAPRRPLTLSTGFCRAPGSMGGPCAEQLRASKPYCNAPWDLPGAWSSLADVACRSHSLTGIAALSLPDQVVPPFSCEPNWVLRTAIGPAILTGQLAVRSTGAQHLVIDSCP